MSRMKEKYPDTSTNRGQRIAIWVIAIVMVGGTLVSFLIFVISSMNPDVSSDQILYNKAVEKMQQEEANQDTPDTSAYIAFLDGYEIKPFDPKSVTKLGRSTLKEGSGPEVKSSDTITANYTGWSYDGAIFDTTKKSAGSVSEPIQFPLSNVIDGWSQGLVGAKAGGVYELTIPSEMAYGGNAGDSATSGPLKFIVEVVSIDKATN